MTRRRCRTPPARQTAVVVEPEAHAEVAIRVARNLVTEAVTRERRRVGLIRQVLANQRDTQPIIHRVVADTRIQDAVVGQQERILVGLTDVAGQNLIGEDVAAEEPNARAAIQCELVLAGQRDLRIRCKRQRITARRLGIRERSTTADQPVGRHVPDEIDLEALRLDVTAVREARDRRAIRIVKVVGLEVLDLGRVRGKAQEAPACCVLVADLDAVRGLRVDRVNVVGAHVVEHVE
ncbi:MAG: hypothetical protein AAGF61_11010, partial [Pseudomonadota bacterium]